MAVNVELRVEKETSIINIVENKNPFSSIIIAQPVVHELEYVGLGIPPSGNLNVVCNVPIALLKTGRVARVNPENPRFGPSLSASVRVFDGKLRLSTSKLAIAIPLPIILTRHRLDRRVRSKILAWHIFGRSDLVLLHARQSLSRDGKGLWTTGWAVFLLVLGRAVVNASQLGPFATYPAEYGTRP